MINRSQGLLELGQDVINLICNEKAQRLDIKTNDSGTIGGQTSSGQVTEGYFKTKLDKTVWDLEGL